MIILTSTVVSVTNAISSTVPTSIPPTSTLLPVFSPLTDLNRALIVTVDPNLFFCFPI